MKFDPGSTAKADWTSSHWERKECMLYNLRHYLPLIALYSMFAIIYGIVVAIDRKARHDDSIHLHSHSGWYWIAMGFTATLLFPLSFAIDLWIALGKKVKKRRQAKYEADYEAKKIRWIKENPVVLYYNIMNGIIAVLRKEDYEESVRETSRNRINGFWKHDDFLQPHSSTALFIHADAREAVPEAYRTGWISDWHDIQQKTKTVLLQDIFVPFASDVLTMKSQQERVRTPAKQQECTNSSFLAYLLDPRIPADL